MKLTNFRFFLDTNHINYKKDHLLKYETYFKMGGSVHSFVVPNTIDELINIINYLRKDDLEFKIIGFTTNVYFIDEFEYSVIISTKNLTSLQISNNEIKVECGYSLQDFVRVTLLERSTGYEGLEGIPGSIGGALVMNAGAYGYTISNHIVNVTCLTPEQNVIVLDKNACEFNHRSSILKKNKDWIILSAVFRLIPARQSDIANNIEMFHIARHTYQEYTYPNLGSMFSVKDDFYLEFLNKNRIYYFICYILKIIYKNPFTKFMMRKNPNNKIFNKLIYTYLLPKKVTHTYSSKSMNILVNNGTSDTNQILDYLSLVKNNLNTTTPIENEVIISPIINGDSKTKNIIDLIESKGLLS